MGFGRLKRFTATGAVSTAEEIIRGLTITPGTTATTVTLREGGAGGTIVGQWLAPANGSAFAIPVFFAVAAPHLTIAGTAAEVSVVL